MTLKAGFKKYKDDPFIFYRVNELGTVVSVVYVDDTLAIGYKPESMNTINASINNMQLG